MNDFCQRQDIKYRYGPLAQKTLHNILKRELLEQFGFENMGLIADALIQRFLEILQDFDPKQNPILPGQLLWLAVSSRHKAQLHLPLWRQKLVPVRLTILHHNDLIQAAQGAHWDQLREQRIVRLLNEAYQQGGVLGQHDVALLLGISQSTVSRIIRNYQNRTHTLLPYRGTVHDLGRSTSHKALAVELHLQGLLTREIARRMNHSPQAVDAYLTDFERVWQLHQDGKSPEQIAFLTRIAPSVVRQYLLLIDQYQITETNASKPRQHRPPNRQQRNPKSTKKGSTHGQRKPRKAK